MGFIYKISNDINDKLYIGQTTFTVEKRWRRHCICYNKPYLSYLSLYKAMNEIGIEHFKIEAIEEVDNKDLDEREKYWIKYYNTFKDGYNSTLGGKLVCLYEFDEEKILYDYCMLRSARKVAKKYGTDHTTIDKIIRKYGIKRFHSLNTIIAEKDGIKYRFDSNADCADFMVNDLKAFGSGNVQTAKGYISDTICGRRKDYYGWKFYKE